jgi:hypothetical protein
MAAWPKRPLQFIAIRRRAERIGEGRMRHLLATQLRERNPVRQTLLAAAAAFVIGGIATGAVLSQAQQTPPPAQQTDDGSPGRGRTGWAHRMMHLEMMRQRALNQRAFALIYPQEDRQLAPADVQKIAEAFLLWRGNHAWKVSDVAPTADGPIGFNLTTPDGSVVAKFTMDPHTGRIQRVG